MAMEYTASSREPNVIK